jgi:hypothetical protein
VTDAKYAAERAKSLGLNVPIYFGVDFDASTRRSRSSRSTLNHGDYFDEVPQRHYNDTLLLFQSGPFTDYDLVDGYHYGRLATGPHKGLWVRLGASPVEMGLIRA